MIATELKSTFWMQSFKKCDKLQRISRTLSGFCLINNVNYTFLMLTSRSTFQSHNPLIYQSVEQKNFCLGLSLFIVRTVADLCFEPQLLLMSAHACCWNSFKMKSKFALKVIIRFIFLTDTIRYAFLNDMTGKVEQCKTLIASAMKVLKSSLFQFRELLSNSATMTLLAVQEVSCTKFMLYFTKKRFKQ